MPRAGITGSTGLEGGHPPAGNIGMAQMVRDHDWAATPLGPRSDWPKRLGLTVELILHSPIAMILLWGPDLTRIYNDAYCQVMAVQHPDDLGLPTRGCWPEGWEFAAPVCEAALRGEGSSFRNQRLILERTGVTEEAWFDLTYVPVRDDLGAVAGILAIVAEVTADLFARLRQHFMGELEQRLRPVRDPLEVMAIASDALGRQLGAGLVAYIDIDPGTEVAVVERDWTDGTMNSIVGRHRLPDFGPDFVAELKRGRMVVIHDVDTDPRSASPGAHRAFGALSIRSLLDVPLIKGGRLDAMLTILCREPRVWTDGDIELANDTAERTWEAVERARAEAALRSSEALLDAIFDSAPVGLGVWDRQLRFLRVNRRLAEINGIEPDAHVGRHPAELLPAIDGLDPLLQRWQAVIETGEPLVNVEVTGTTPAEPGVIRHWVEHFFPIRVDAQVVGLGAIVEDITARRRAEDHRALLTSELNHRVKNTLAIVQALARQTFAGAAVPPDARAAFEGRLSALAAAHDLLTHGHWESAALGDLVRDVFGLCGIPRERSTVEGPTVVLQPRAAVSMALAIHELATNATKYGAMSNRDGRIAVTWSLTPTPSPRLDLHWRESDGPKVLRPGRRGFGSRMIQQVLAQEFQGQVDVEYRTDGLLCHMSAPWPEAGEPR